MSDPAEIAEQRQRRARRRRKHNPITNPANSWTWRFLPGLLLGFGLSTWLNYGNNKSRPAPKQIEVEPEDPAEPAEEQPVGPPVPMPAPGEEMKMVLVVNEELKMTKGKIAAQCGHAVYGMAKKLQPKHAPLLQQWERTGQAKIALKGDGGADQLRELAGVAAHHNIAAHAVFDAGRTQIAAGSMTVLALGPAGKASLDKVTGHLKLL